MTGIIALLIGTAAFLDLQPPPQSVFIQQRGLMSLDAGIPLVVDDDFAREDQALFQPLFDALGFTPPIVSASTFKIGDSGLYIGVLGKHAAFEHRSMRRYAADLAEADGDAYNLYVLRSSVVLAGKNRQGLIHGIYTLLQMIQESRRLQLNHRGSPAIPQAEIRDFPDLDIRGAYVREPLNREQINLFAMLKCNMLVFENDDFYQLNDERLALWNAVFQNARAAGITPVPLFEFFNVPEVLLRKRPTAVEGRSRIDRITLPEEDWVSLTRGNIILTPENPIRITLNNVPLGMRQDYAITEGTLEPPFGSQYASPWLVRRIPGGKIPSGAAVEATYSYAPYGSAALCPNAPETRMLLQETLAPLVQGLSPSILHCGFGDITRLNQDLRCRASGHDNARQFSDALMMMHEIAREVNPEIRLMMWADALTVPESGDMNDPASLHSAIGAVPEGTHLGVRSAMASSLSYDGAGQMQAMKAGRPHPVFVAMEGSSAQFYSAVHQLASPDSRFSGIMVLDANPSAAGTAAALSKAWNVSARSMIWPELLNSFFETDLWAPEFEQVKETLLAFIERRLILGEAPKELRDRFAGHVGNQRRFLQADQDELRKIMAFLEVITKFMELEYTYATGDERSALRELPNLVKRYGEVDQTMPADRLERIQATIRDQSLFAPASIVFGRPLAYYRPFQAPRGSTPCEAPVKLEYDDSAGSARATLDFLTVCGPVFRIDFETVNARSVAVSVSDDGVQFERVESRPTTTARGLRGPLLLPSPVTKRYVRLHVESHGEQAVLREVRAFVLRQPAKTRCPMLSDAEAASFGIAHGRHVGMLYSDSFHLATAPTEIRLARDSRFLHIAVTARDPLPHAMGAAMTDNDAPLWNEESVEVRIKAANRPARRLLINPLGARYDAMAVASNLETWDNGWDGDWQAESRQNADGWTAVLRIPFAILGGPPKTEESWQFNFYRYRNNVERETSMWAVKDVHELSEYGTVTFD